MKEEPTIINVWKGESIVPLVITPAKKRVIFNQNLLVQLVYLDNCPLFLALQTVEKESDYWELCSLLKESNYLRTDGDVEDAISLALDTLLDFGIFKAEWQRSDHVSKRIFINRNELFDMFGEFEGKLMEKLSGQGFIETAKDLTTKLHLGEANELPFEDCYYENRIEETEEKFLKFVHDCLLKDKEYDILWPLARKGWAIFDHLKDKHNITCPCDYGISTEIKDRKICVFDDAVKKGRHLYKVTKRLLEMGVPRENITLVTYLINRNSYFDPNNDTRKKIKEMLGKDIEYYKALNDLEFRREVSDILMYVGSFGSIIDADHLAVSIELSEPISCKDIMKMLKDIKIGKVLEPGVGLQYLHPNKKKITIDQIDYNTLTNHVPPESFLEKDQCKIRMIWTYDPQTFLTSDLTLTPIVNPRVKCDGVSEAKGRHRTRLRFCDEFHSPIAASDDQLCVDCTLYQMIPKLLQSFLEVFVKRLPVSVRITDVKWIEFESKYREASVMKRWKRFKKRLHSMYA